MTPFRVLAPRTNRRHGGYTTSEPLLVKNSSVTVANDIEALGLTISACSHRQGVVVDDLESKGNAWRAGLTVGDVITAVNGKLALTHEQAMDEVRSIASTPVPDVVFSLAYKTSRLLLEFCEETPGAIEMTFNVGGGEEEDVRKVGFFKCDPAEIISFAHAPKGKRGVVVATVGIDSAAFLRVGDKVLSINRRLVHTPAEAAKLMRSRIAGRPSSRSLIEIGCEIGCEGNYV